MGSWYDRKMSRQTARKENRYDWRAGHRLRRGTSFPGQGEKWVLCLNGAFGNLKNFDSARYKEYAAGTAGNL